MTPDWLETTVGAALVTVLVTVFATDGAWIEIFAIWGIFTGDAVDTNGDANETVNPGCAVN